MDLSGALAFDDVNYKETFLLMNLKARMKLSRRTFLGGGCRIRVDSVQADVGGQPAGDAAGKNGVGYQGWFACLGDGAPIKARWHWSNNWSQPPSISSNSLARDS